MAIFAANMNVEKISGSRFLTAGAYLSMYMPKRKLIGVWVCMLFHSDIMDFAGTRDWDNFFADLENSRLVPHMRITHEIKYSGTLFLWMSRCDFVVFFGRCLSWDLGCDFGALGKPNSESFLVPIFEIWWFQVFGSAKNWGTDFVRH